MFYLIDVQNNTKVVEYRMVQGRREASSRTPTTYTDKNMNAAMVKISNPGVKQPIINGK